MSHANAALTPRHRLKVAELVVKHGYPISEVAARFQCSWPTVKRWVDRYMSGDRQMHDHSSRPHTMPNKTPLPVTKRLVSLRLRLREGPVQLAARVKVAPSTAHQILRRCRLNRLAYLDRATGEPVRRYEHDHPGSLIHVDVKKLGNIPDGGGWRFVGRQQGDWNRQNSTIGKKNAYGQPKLGERASIGRSPLPGYWCPHRWSSGTRTTCFCAAVAGPPGTPHSRPAGRAG